MEDSPPNWHFDYMAPIYDYLSPDRDYETILEGLQLSSEDRILDLAGGTGAFLDELIRRGVVQPENAHLLDLSEPMLEQARERGLEHVHHGDSTDTPFPDDHFQAVFTGDAIHHMGDLEAVFAEVRRILIPGGRLVIEEFDPGRLIGKVFYGIEILSGMGSHFREPEELANIVERAGFESVDIVQDSYIYYLRARVE